MSRADGAYTAPEQRQVQLEGDVMGQLTALMVQGWMVLARDGAGWTIERARPEPLAPPPSRGAR